MPSYTVEANGRSYEIEAPDMETATASLAKFIQPEDKYQEAARTEYDQLKAKGVPVDVSSGRRFLQGATFNTADEILAGMMTPLEMIKRGTLNPAEGYRYAKAREDHALNQAHENGGALGAAAELGGGLFGGAGLASGGVTAARLLPQGAGLIRRSVASALDGVGLGALAGAGEGNSLSERGSNAIQGGLFGGIVGGVAPTALALGGKAISPIVSNIRARINPNGYAETQVARALTESGRAPQEIADQVARAASEGQPMFTVADAMGNPGQRMLSTVARSPGEGRTATVEFLENRQAGQGRRVANALAEGFDTPTTASQTRARLTGARDTTADAEYGAVRTDAKPVDITPAIEQIDSVLSPGVNRIASPVSNIANDSAESALANFRSRLTDGTSNLTDFAAVQRVRGDLSDAIQKATRAGEGNKARLLGQVLGEMDNAMEAASAGHRAANANFRQASRNIEAIDTGRTAALRGRSEDTIPAFRALTPEGQQGFRAGYVDPLIEQAQGGAFGVNKARPLTSDAFHDEANAMAPGAPLMQSRIARENAMFETRNHALGGSRTADNLADEAAMGVDPVAIGRNVLTGNVSGAASAIMQGLSNGWNGNTAAVRAEISNILLRRGQNVSAAALEHTLNEAMTRINSMVQLARSMGRGATAATVIGTQEARR